MTPRRFIPTRPVPPYPGTALLGLKATGLLELHAEVRTGFSVDTVQRLADHLGLDVVGVLTLLELSPSAYQRRRRESRPLSRQHSTALWHLACVTEVAERFFEDTDAAHRWLITLRRTFGGMTPLQLALAPGGVEYVRMVLGRLEHGIYS